MKTLFFLLLFSSVVLAQHPLTRRQGGTAPWISADSLNVLTSNGSLMPTWETLSAPTLGAWSITGNSGLTSSNFLGTIGNKPLIFKVHNYSLMQFDPTVFSSYGPSIQLGFSAQAVNDGDIAIGTGSTTADGGTSLAMGGANTYAHGLGSTAIGQGVTANGIVSMALGDYTTAQGDNSLATGDNIKVGLNSFGFNSGILAHEGVTAYTLDISAFSNVACFNDVDILLTNNYNHQSTLKFYAQNSSMTLSGAHQTSFKAPNTLSADVNYTLPSAQGGANTFLKNNGSGALSWASAGGGGGLINWIDSINTASPNATVPVVSLVTKNAATDIDAVVQPKGLGGFGLSIPDGTASGGNKRGVHSIDMQLDRDANNLTAASDYSSIFSGYDNEIDGAAAFSSIVGGESNWIHGQTDCLIGSGRQNLIIGTGDGRSFIGGGFNNQIASSTYATILGGINNSISSTSHSSILGGSDLTLLGKFDFGFLGDNMTHSHPMTFIYDGNVILGNVSLWMANNDGTVQPIIFQAKHSNSGQVDTTGDPTTGVLYVGLKAPDTVVSSIVYTLPTHDGTSGQVLQTDGNGHLSWVNHYYDSDFDRKILY